MAVDLAAFEQKLHDGIHNAVAEVAAHEPAIEDALDLALQAAGVPTEVTVPLAAALKGLRSHFEARKAAEQAS